MSYEVKATDYFGRRLKRLSKRYKSLLDDLSGIIEDLGDNPHLGVSIGKDCFKIRIAISSKGKGKSGGARLITYVRLVENTIFLIDIFDKSEQAGITAKELQSLIKDI